MATGKNCVPISDQDHVRQDGVTGPARELRDGNSLSPVLLSRTPASCRCAWECSGKLPCILCAVDVLGVLAETLPRPVIAPTGMSDSQSDAFVRGAVNEMDTTISRTPLVR